MNKTRFLLISIFIIMLVSAAFYYRTADYRFVRSDDPMYIEQNPLIKKLDGENIKRIFTESYFFNYQPLVLLSYAAEYKFFKLAPGGYHITNTVIHIINSVLVFLLIYIITKNGWVSLIVGLLFSLHPIQAESVAWVSERKGLMCAFFYILAFMSYIRYSRKDEKSFYFLSIGLFLFSLLSKPMSVTFPLILMLFDYYEGKLTKPKLMEKIPFFALSAVFSIIIILAQAADGSIAVNKLTHLSLLFTYVFYNIGFYISKLTVPIKLSLHYGYPENISYISIESAIAVLVFIVFIIYLMNFKKIKKEINFGILFFLISLIPILRIVPIGNTIANDRYMYIPMIGFFFAIAMLISSLVSYKPKLKIVLAVFLPIYLLQLSVLTYKQLDVWKDSKNLWANVLRFNPDCRRAYMGMAYHYMEKGDQAKAREYITLVLNKEGWREKALFNMGLSYFYEKSPADANVYFNQLIKEYPENKKGNNTYAYRFLGDASAFYNNPKKAAFYYEQSLKLDPKNSQAHFGYANVMESYGRIDEAIKHHKLAIKYNSEWPQPKEALARIIRSRK
jgi:hypothetical protein